MHWIAETSFGINRCERNAIEQHVAAVTIKRVESRNRMKLVEPDNGSDHRAGTVILQAEKSARKPGLWSSCVVICCLLREP
jgi:hypothetical protein